jgi:hypothetical protein
VREVLKACIRDGKTCTAIVNDRSAGMGLSVGREPVRKFVKANLARPEKEAQTNRISQMQARPFLQAMGRQELGKRGCL